MMKTARLRWLPKAILALAASYFAFSALWLYFIDSTPAVFPPSDGGFKDIAALICTALAILLALSMRLPSPARSKVALLVASSGAAILLVEVVLFLAGQSARRYTSEKVVVKFAQEAGRPVGQLSLWPFIRDLRRNEVAGVFPFLGSLFNRAYVSRPDAPRLITLAGISEVITVSCNESGRFEPYFSDEHGFNNPPGLHDSGPLDVVLVGDSFTYGGCVRRADSTAGRLRMSIPRTLNLGISGAGPLASLAALIEYASMAAPRIVVWGWYEGNDLKDAVLEAREPELQRYLAAQAPFGLKALQEEVDFALKDLSARKELMGRAQILGDLLMLRAIRSRLGIMANPSTPSSGFAPTEAVLSAARNLVRGWGGELVLVYHPSSERYCGSVESWRNECDNYRHMMPRALGARAEIIGLFERLGVPVVDGHTAFLETGRPEDMFFHPYSHYSPEGYRVIADAVLREIRPMLDHRSDRSAGAPAAPLAGGQP